MAAPVLIRSIPSHVDIKLAVIAMATGWSESVLRREILEGRMIGGKILGAYVTSWENYQAWAEEEAERGGDARTTPERELELLQQSKRAKGQGRAGSDKSDRGGEPAQKAKGTRRRKRRPVPIIYDLESFMAKKPEGLSPLDGEHL